MAKRVFDASPISPQRTYHYCCLCGNPRDQYQFFVPTEEESRILSKSFSRKLEPKQRVCEMHWDIEPGSMKRLPKLPEKRPGLSYRGKKRCQSPSTSKRKISAVDEDNSYDDQSWRTKGPSKKVRLTRTQLERQLQEARERIEMLEAKLAATEQEKAETERIRDQLRKENRDLAHEMHDRDEWFKNTPPPPPMDPRMD